MDSPSTPSRSRYSDLPKLDSAEGGTIPNIFIRSIGQVNFQQLSIGLARSGLSSSKSMPTKKLSTSGSKKKSLPPGLLESVAVGVDSCPLPVLSLVSNCVLEFQARKC